MQTISRSGVAFIAGFESFVAYPYDDVIPPVKGKYREWTGGPKKGTITIGYGHTNDAGSPKIFAGMRLTEPEAAAILDADLDVCEQEVRSWITAPMTQNQFDALVSMQFNTGGLKTSSLRTMLNAGNYNGAADQFLRWNKVRVNGVFQVWRGLTRRREAERALFLSAPRVSVSPSLLIP